MLYQLPARPSPTSVAPESTVNPTTIFANANATIRDGRFSATGNDMNSSTIYVYNSPNTSI
ncbi:hypothetical protein GYMLUDRAFT_38489 [Collybiopsis luxurians FD-317 M1]|nr:hypothetical protein GYMLUDRAFT_38489 [Collybiopsis luxurians FD-317 M1]